jgi:conjugal transfer mating pair stabilization protein TraG
MSIWPMYVTANGELAQAVLNAVAILLNSATFATAIKISIIFAIIGTAISYIRGRDITVFAKWFITYFIVAAVMLGPQVKLQIIDVSDPNKANLTVDHIPYGLGVPASFITSFAHGLTVAFEAAFRLPDDFQYNKTGMLFGSRLFKLSTELNITSPELKAELNQYIKNCVIPDINILKRYNMGDLAKSTQLTSTVFDAENSSNTRGLYLFNRVETKDALGVKGSSIQGQEFVTCMKAAPLLKKYLEEEIKGDSLINFARRLFTSKDITDKDAADKLLSGIASAYSEFNYSSLSASALDIATQNLLINSLRDGFRAYSAEANDTAGLLNLSTTQAMERMRMNLATSRNMAIYAVPIIHTALFLMFLGLFPVIVILAFQPSLFAKIIKNYFYGLIWLESWPLMFACLNIIVTFYMKSSTGAIGASGLTMQNIDLVALEHSDIANMAGYLMGLIPFISGGLVYGMSQVFTSAASHIGGVLQSSATSAASEAATGNIHLGNASWSNVNANKLDTNYLRRGGLKTEQTESGLTRKTTADGSPVYDSSEIQSRLPVHLKGSEMLSAAFSEQAEEAQSAGIQDQQNRDHSISNAMAKSKTFSELMDNRKSLGADHATKDVLSHSENLNNMLSVAKSVADREGITQEDAARRMSEAYIDGRLGVGGRAGTPQALSASAHGEASLGAGLKGSISSEARIGHTQTKDINITGEEARKFAQNYDKLKSFDVGKHAGEAQSELASLTSGISADLRKAESYSRQQNIHMSEAQSFRESAALVRQNSNQVDSDYNQILVQHVIKTEGKERAEHLFAGQDTSSLTKLEGYAKDLSHNSTVMAKYQNWSSSVNPKSYYEKESGDVAAKEYDRNVEKKYNINGAYLQKLAPERGIPTAIDFDKKYKQTTREIDIGRSDIRQKIDLNEGEVNKEYKQLDAKVKKGQEAGIKKAQHPTVFNTQSSFGYGGKLIGKLMQKINTNEEEST